jgi:hypothetical protein
MRPRVDEQKIRELAYRIWESEGKRSGCSEDDWFRAENQLLSAELASHQPGPSGVDESVKESFPASDAPSSHLPDEPPINADAKWAAAAAAAEEAQRMEAQPDQALSAQSRVDEASTPQAAPSDQAQPAQDARVQSKTEPPKKINHGDKIRTPSRKRR